MDVLLIHNSGATQTALKLALQRFTDQGQITAKGGPARCQAVWPRPGCMSATCTCRVFAPGTSWKARAEAHSCNSMPSHNAAGRCWEASVSLLVLQLEAAARERVNRSDRQADEAQVPSDLQVFLHSTAQFGPASMRELMVGQRSFFFSCM